MHLVPAALRILGALALGVILGVSSVGTISSDPARLLVLGIVYAAIGGGIIAVVSPRYGAFLLLGWAAPWLLVWLVVMTDDSIVLFPAIITALYLLALCLSFHRARHHREAMPAGGN
jgi:hypothetical protein